MMLMFLLGIRSSVRMVVLVVLTSYPMMLPASASLQVDMQPTQIISRGAVDEAAAATDTLDARSEFGDVVGGVVADADDAVFSSVSYELARRAQISK